MKKSNLSSAIHREQAEDKLNKQKHPTVSAIESDNAHLLQELQVHQIELEMQNEELVQARVEVEAVLKQYTELYDLAPVGYFTLGRDGEISKVNLAGAALLGTERSKLLNRRLGVFVSTQSMETLNTFLDQVFTSKKKATREIELLKAGAIPLWVHIEASEVDEQNKTCRAVLIDITERKQAEETLRESETRYKSLVETQTDLIARSDLDGRLTFVNDAYCKTFSKTREELLGKIFTPTVSPEDWPIVTALLKAIQVPPHQMQTETRHSTTSGIRVLSWDNVAIIDEFGKVRELQGIGRDITERRQAEQALGESEVKFRQTFDLSPIGIVLVGLDKRFILCNLAFSQSLGYGTEELVGKLIDDVTFPEDSHIGMDEMIAIAKGDITKAQVHKRYIRKDGQVIWGEVTISLIKDSKGRAKYFLGIIQDVTARKQVEEALAESGRKLHTLYETMSEGIVYEDHDGKIISANPAAERLLGLSFDQMQGRTSVDPRWKAIHADGSPFPGETHSLNVAAKTGKPATDEIMGIYNPKSGAYVWLSVNSTPEFLPGEKNPFRAYAVFRDITDRKRMEDALHESEIKLLALINAVHESVFLMEIDGKVIAINETTATRLGALTTDIIGHNIFSFLPLDVAEKRRSYVEQVIATGKFVSFEDERDEMWVDHTIYPVKDETGKVKLLAVYGYDITERKRAEVALRESEDKFSKAFQTSPYAITITRPEDGTFIEVNDAFTSMAGLTREEALTGSSVGLKLWVNDEDRQLVVAALRAGKVILGKEYQFRIKSGKVITGIFSAQVIHLSQGLCILSSINDISERKQAEQEILKLNAELERRVIERTSQLQNANMQLESELTERKRADKALRVIEEQFRRLSDAAFEAIIIHDGGILLSANNQYGKMFGYEPEELLGKQVMPLTIAPGAIEGVKKMIATGGVGPYESTGLKKDGTRFPMEIRVREMEYEGRKVRVAAIMDITERKKAEDEINRQTAQLEAANKELEAFSYSVSHDLRAPLRGIDGWSQALLEDYGNILDGQAKTYLERVRSETKRMSQLIDDLLQLSRLTSAEMTTEKVNLSALAGTIAAHLQEEQPGRQVKFVIQPSLNTNGDPRLLEIALSNLLDNAFKFTGKTPQAHIEFGQTEIEGQKAFFVRDNGVGFDMAMAKKLFGAFQRMHKASDYPGTGVGLTTVQRIIHRHGGRIWAESAINQGATFYFTIEEIQ
jgi:PAS domain S-box-containing protein